MAEDIPLDIIYEDDDLAVINKPAGMMVHAGAGATDDDRNRGTLVNALLHHFAQLSEVGGETRPGIVHRLDKETSGLILVAAQRRRPSQPGQAVFWTRSEEALHRAGAWLARAPARHDQRGDQPRRHPAHSHDHARQRRPHAPSRITKCRERLDSPYGKFALVDVRIETGRTHQIRVHMASIGHPVVGDTLYGAAGVLRSAAAPRKTSRKRSAAERDAVDPTLSPGRFGSIATFCTLHPSS